MNNQKPPISSPAEFSRLKHDREVKQEQLRAQKVSLVWTPVLVALRCTDIKWIASYHLCSATRNGYSCPPSERFASIHSGLCSPRQCTKWVAKWTAAWYWSESSSLTFYTKHTRNHASEWPCPYEWNGSENDSSIRNAAGCEWYKIRNADAGHTGQCTGAPGSKPSSRTAALSAVSTAASATGTEPTTVSGSLCSTRCSYFEHEHGCQWDAQQPCHDGCFSSRHAKSEVVPQWYCSKRFNSFASHGTAQPSFPFQWACSNHKQYRKPNPTEQPAYDAGAG